MPHRPAVPPDAPLGAAPPPADLPPDLLDELLDVASEAVGAGARTALSWLHRDDLVVEHKTGPADLVSQADRQTEEAVRAVLTRRRPSDAVLGEEGGGGPFDDDAVVWVVDPIDGTTNYLYGYDCWAVSVAAVRAAGTGSGEQGYRDVLAAVVCEPVTGRTTAARAGGGTWCDGRRQHVRDTAELSSALVEVGFGHGEVRRHAGDMVGALDAAARDVRRCGSAATSLAMVATGRADAYWGPTVQLWDYAAGVLLVREAGGVVGDLTGRADLPAARSVLATAPALFDPLRDLLAPVYAGTGG